MEQKIEGNEYNFVVKLTDNKIFEIIATRKSDNRKSSITNLNVVIGEIVYPILNTIYVDDTSLNVDNFQIGKNLFDLAVDTLNDTFWVSRYLESYLDEDFSE